MSVIPVPSNRSSDLLLQARLVLQLQQHQLQLLKIQDRLATGLRVANPSDDTVAASQAIHLQMLLEQKEKSREAFRTANDFLNRSDAAGAEMSDLLIEARSLVLGIVNATSTDTERAAVATQLRTMVRQLVRVANSDYRGRYLFAGSRVTTVPFDFSSGFVEFRGNDRTLSGYTDGGFLVATNATADQMIGVYSPGKLGTVDLDPVATLDTKLSDLRQGQGIRLGSILVSDGNRTSMVDLTGSVTIRDVVRRLEASPPEGRKLTVRLIHNQLVLQLDDGLGGNLTVRDSGGGSTAKDLGIANSTGVGSGPLVGQDLDPRLTPQTLLADLLGRRAYGLLRVDGNNNDLWITARQRGATFNEYRFHLVNDSLLQAAGGIQPGEEFAYLSDAPVAARAALTFSGSNNNLILTANEPGTQFNQVRIEVTNAGLIGNAATVTYDPDARQLTIGVDALDRTEIQTVIDTINASNLFTANYDASDPTDGGYVPTAIVSAADAGVVKGNTGNSGGEANTVFIHVVPGASTASQVRAALLENPEIAALFDVTIDGKDTAPGTVPGSGTVDGQATVQLTGGSGQELDQQSGLLIRQSTNQFLIDLSEAVTIEDLLNAINGAGAGVVAAINESGTGINVRSVLAGADFAIGENGGSTATQLGLRTFAETTLFSELNHELGVAAVEGPDFAVILKDGTRLEFDVSNVETIGDLIELINSHPNNQDPATRVVASLAPIGNGIELRADASGGSQPLTVERIRGRAVWDLGLLPEGVDRAEAVVSPDGLSETVRGADVNPDEVDGLFNTLIRLADAVEKFDERQLQRLMALLDQDIDRVAFARAQLGAQGRFLDTLLSQLDQEMVDLRRNLSEEIDADLVATISELTQRQTALQATLQLTGRLFQLSLLDFL